MRASAARADPIVALADLDEVRLSQVLGRLGPAAVPTTDAVLEALAAACLDVLVVREMAALGRHPAAERPLADEVDGFLAQVWPEDGQCHEIAEKDLRWRYLRDVARYKHPDETFVWDALFACCTAAQLPCDRDEVARCRLAQRPGAARLARSLRGVLPRTLAAGVTATLEASPIKESHSVPFEAAVAAAGGGDPERPGPELRRYSFFATTDPRFPNEAFRHADPAIENAVFGAPLGSLVGPVDTADGVHVLLVVARLPARHGLEDPASRAEVRRRVCAERARSARQAYLEKLLATARIEWRDQILETTFGADVVARLRAAAPGRAPARAP